jgi:hypothetical protein
VAFCRDPPSPRLTRSMARFPDGLSRRARRAMSYRRYRPLGRPPGRVMNLGHGISHWARGVSKLIHDRAPAIPFVLGVFLISTVLAVTVMSWGDRPDEPAPILSVPGTVDQVPPPQETVEDLVHINSVGDYRFTYPSAWDVQQVESRTRVESPSGEILMSFGHGSPGDIATSSNRLLSSILDLEGNDPRSNQRLIGTTWEQIASSRSLVVSGMTTDATGRSIRFLAITVPGVPRNYSISVLVPARSDPTQILSTIEAIVSSFEILSPDREL